MAAPSTPFDVTDEDATLLEGEELHNMRREHDTALAQASEKYMTLETTYKEAFALKSGLETSMKEIEAGREKMVTEIEGVREELVNCQKQLAASRSQALKERLMVHNTKTAAPTTPSQDYARTCCFVMFLACSIF